MIRSNAILAVKTVALDSAMAVLYFPVWWYTKGAARAAGRSAHAVTSAARSFGFHVWLKNLFRPMYGQYDIWGRAISFFLRIVMIIWYSFILGLMVVFEIALFLGYLALPVLVFGELLLQVSVILKSTGL